MPFAGDEDAARAAIENLRRLRIGPGDELIVADNTPGGTFPDCGSGIRVVPATHERSPFHARNAGAEHAEKQWLLFIDADCRPIPDLLDEYFRPVPSAACGLVAGAVVPTPDQAGLAPRYARARGHLQSDWHAQVRPGWPYPSGITGNMLVRAVAWRGIGGFQEGIVDGGDIEFCWRLQDAGWELERRPKASVEHMHVTTLAATARQAHRHAAGRRWINHRYPGSFPPPALIRPLLRSAAGAVVWTLTGRFERALFKLIDARWFWADFRGYMLGDNRARPVLGAAEEAALMESFPTRGDPELESRVQVEALSRPVEVDNEAVRRLRINYAEDDPPLARLGALLRCAFLHPLRTARLARSRRLAILAPVALRLRNASRASVGDVEAGDRAAIAMLGGIEWSGSIPPGRGRGLTPR